MALEPHTETNGVRCKQTLKFSSQTAPEFIPQQDSPTSQSGTSDCGRSRSRVPVTRMRKARGTDTVDNMLGPFWAKCSRAQAAAGLCLQHYRGSILIAGDFDT